MSLVFRNFCFDYCSDRFGFGLGLRLRLELGFLGFVAKCLRAKPFPNLK